MMAEFYTGINEKVVNAKTNINILTPQCKKPTHLKTKPSEVLISRQTMRLMDR
jgi:hypothetical protein